MANKDVIRDALINLEEENVNKLVKESIKSSVPAGDILKELQGGLIEIGKRFEKGEFYTPELIYAGMIMKINMALLEPLMKGVAKERKGKVVLGTVYGDVHDIGKDIVKSLLEGSGFEVIDLGTNVEPSKFVDSIKESEAKVVGLSALLTISFNAIADTVKAIEDSGIRGKVLIMVGGAPVTELVAKSTRCDFYGKDAYEGLKYVSNIYGV